MALKDCKNTDQSVSQPEERAQKDTQGQSLTRCLTYIARSTELLFQKMLGFLKKPYKRTSRRVKNRSLRLFQRAGYFAERCYAVLTTPYRCCKRFGAQLGETQGGQGKDSCLFPFCRTRAQTEQARHFNPAQLPHASRCGCRAHFGGAQLHQRRLRDRRQPRWSNHRLYRTRNYL